ncbi:galactoside 2-alpha-L-fucosyltransferase SEC1-like [Chrysoperla carnea]|uniref:galactoside 2-alpha-L-fucosyltransferase SEC1-like n=1 Tax=Chrysoperla carnea TaxID=189513 RepID=UPI001D07D271|nr:galactoside 2-alpha-L-fucosyltransferase SEC1-like [Chrysoperla carnea]
MKLNKKISCTINLKLIFCIIIVIILTKVHSSGNIKLCQYEEKVQTLKKINPHPCPRKGFVTVFAAGHLGNHISQYAGVWSVGRLTGLMPIVPAQNILHDAKLNVTESSQSINYEITYIGIHVRRTDYISLLKRYGVKGFVKPEYFLQAMKYFENKFPNVIFIVISDDPKWCKKNIGNHQNVYIASKINLYNTTEQDFAVMAACNHSIIDYGTFGAWGAILAGGETIVYKIPNMQPGHTGSEIAELLPNWHYL